MKQFKKISVLTLIVMLGMFVSISAYAMNLKDARDSGAVGERLDGYVAVLKSSDEVDALVEDVNGKRLVQYKRISQENSQSVEIVAQLAAKQIIERLSKGHYYQSPDGSWVQKK